MQHRVCRAAGWCPCTDRGPGWHPALLGPCHKGTGREKGSGCQPGSGQSRLARGGAGRAPALSPLGECDSLGLTAH